jgi:hypothetical protein
MKREKIYILLTNVFEMCVKYTVILNLAFEGQGLCESQFSVFHVDIRVDVMSQNLSFTAPFSLMHHLPIWAGFQTIINSRIVIYFSLQLYKCYFMVLYARGYTLKDIICLGEASPYWLTRHRMHTLGHVFDELGGKMFT